MNTVRGWRYWMVEEGGILVSPKRLPGQVKTQEVWGSPDARVAQCRFHDHPAPYPGCSCGYRVCENLYDVMLELQRDYRYTTLNTPARCPVVAILYVEGSGRIAPGVDDPPGVWQCERLRIVPGPGYISPTVRESDADELRRWFGVWFRATSPGLSLVDWCIELNGGTNKRPAPAGQRTVTPKT